MEGFRIVEGRLKFEMLTMMDLKLLNPEQEIEILFFLAKYLAFVKINQLILFGRRKKLY
jgi:hypothetical protein